jgi:hypothetical protein
MGPVHSGVVHSISCTFRASGSAHQ